MQLLDVILWPRWDALPPRRISFKPGRINVIVGGSETGKSSIWPVVDYCLGSSTLRVPLGVTRNSTSWFGALFLVRGARLLLARPNPEHISDPKVLIEEGKDVAVPFRPAGNATVEELKANLDSRLTAFPETPWGRITCRDITAINVRAQYLLSNPSAVLVDESKTSSIHKIRHALPRLLMEEAPAELSAVRSTRDSIEKIGAHLGKATKHLTDRAFMIYETAQRLNLVARSNLPRDQWDIRKVVFELEHALRINRGIIDAVEATLSSPGQHRGTSSAQSLQIVTENGSDFGKDILVPSWESDNAKAETRSTRRTGRADEEDPLLFAARLFTLGGIQELLVPTEYMLDHLTDLRHEWRSLNARLGELRRRGARFYIGLTDSIRQYAKIMRLDYCDRRILLEERTLNLKFFLEGNKELDLASIGGVRNFAGYGISLLLALHQAIDLQGGLGVNRFLFIDEMSQAFSVASKGDEDGHETPMALALKAIRTACSAMHGRFQVILLESAFEGAGFDRLGQNVHLVEDWHSDGGGLVPAPWRTSS